MSRKKTLMLWTEFTLLSLNYTILGACLILLATIYGYSVLYICCSFFLLQGIVVSLYLVVSKGILQTDWVQDSDKRTKIAESQLVSYKMKPFSVTDMQRIRKKYPRTFKRMKRLCNTGGK
ncbi:hypothetical protein TNCT_383741 [Trichonephila clavata]|uniref:Uncharacterized protein n=1 Tax=Trichonephila clavata TaxID=2740835 RepID=A0A8X6LE37_TRICU|nr:hypothetical protein TNCT_383741 [Trichonephila clavata]